MKAEGYQFKKWHETKENKGTVKEIKPLKIEKIDIDTIGNLEIKFTKPMEIQSLD